MVHYRVGEIIEHKRYGYRGVIFGWDPVCTAGDDWIAQMNVDALPGQPPDLCSSLRDDKIIDTYCKPPLGCTDLTEGLGTMMPLPKELNSSGRCVTCAASACAGGRNQPFYHVLVDIGSRPNQSTYVAQENISRFSDMPIARTGYPEAINHPEVLLLLRSSSAVQSCPGKLGCPKSC